MPHCIIEYSSSLESTLSPSLLVDVVHQATLDSGLFDTSHIKTRALAYDYFQLAVEYHDFIHVTIRLHSGRTVLQKQRLTAGILQALENIKLSAITLTVEAVDMHSESYAKHSVIQGFVSRE